MKIKLIVWVAHLVALSACVAVDSFKVSDATAAKQLRTRPELRPNSYRLAQQVIDEGTPRESGERSLSFISRAGGELWRAVVKRTGAGDELFLQTLHRSNERQLRRHLRKAGSDD